MKLSRQFRGSNAVCLLALGFFGLACPAPAPSGELPAGSGGSGGAPRASGGSNGNSGGSSGQGGSSQGGSPGSGGQTAGQGGSGQGGSGQGGAGTGGVSGGGGQAAGGAGPGSGGAPGPGDAGSGTGGSAGDAGGSDNSNFSFFVVSLKALQTLSGKTEGFGGDLRFGKADGLAGADEICRRAADMALPGAGAKPWRALLSATKGANGMPVNARDRIGKGPWYDRKGQLFARDLTELFSAARPPATPALANDITNERGEPNHFVGAAGYTPGRAVDNHDTLTGSDATGMLDGTLVDTCNDWTSTTAGGRPTIGHSWPRSATSGRHWISDHSVPGCAAGLDRTLGGSGAGGCVGCSGGYGGFFCFVAN